MSTCTEIDFHITNRCPMRCTYCNRDANKAYLSELTQHEILTLLLRPVATRGPFELHITGGEPLLRTDLEGIIADAIELGARNIGVSTSGSRATPDRVRRLREVGVTWMGVTIDALSELGHTQNRPGRRAYSGAIEALDNIIDAGLMSLVKIVGTLDNFHQIKEVVDYGFRRGASACYIYYLRQVGRASGMMDRQPDAESWQKLELDLADQFRAMKRHGARLAIEHPFPDLPLPPFSNRYRMADHFYLLCNGDVFPQVQQSFKTSPEDCVLLGNIREDEYLAILDGFDRDQRFAWDFAQFSK